MENNGTDQQQLKANLAKRTADLFLALIRPISKHIDWQNVAFTETETYENGFAKYFQIVILPALRSLETHRQGYIRFIRIILLCYLLAGTGLMLALYIPGLLSAENSPILLSLFLTIPFAICPMASAIFADTAKQYLTGLILGFFGPLRYNAKGGIARQQLSAAMMLSDKNDYIGSDLIEGMHQNVRMQFCQMQILGATNALMKHLNIRKTLFKGAVITFEIERQFLGHTLLTHGHRHFIAPKSIAHLKQVGLADPEFNNSFKLYSNDQVEARYLVNPALMVQLLNLAEHFKTDALEASFIDNKMTIFAPFAGPLFEPANLGRSSIYLKEIKDVMAQIHAILKTLEIIKINASQTASESHKIR